MLNDKTRVEVILNNSDPSVDEMVRWLREHEDLSFGINVSSDSLIIEVTVHSYNHWDECQETAIFTGESFLEALYKVVIWSFDDN